MKSECIYEIIDFPKYHPNDLIDFCPGRLFRLGMLCTHLSRAALRKIKTNNMYLVYKTLQGRNLWYEPCSKVTFSYIKKIIYCLPHTQKCMRNFANSISYALMLKPLQSLQIAAACKVIHPKYIL